MLFADVVGSMRLAAKLDSERLRTIMNELFNRSAAVVQRYQGTVDKFTGDGLMALFGAPTALEDHALRACIAALEIQDVAAELGRGVREIDGVDLRLRVGLNSGDVIVGEIGAGPGRYTAVGHSVGLAQRMEAGAPSGAVLCSMATAHLVEDHTDLGPVRPVAAKGFDDPVLGRQLLSVESERLVLGRSEGLLFGRNSELRILASLFGSGESVVVGIIGSPGVGKSRLVREFAGLAAEADIVIARCDVHTAGVAFRALARLLRALFGVQGVDPADARDRTAAQLNWSDPQSVEAQMLFEAMGISDRGCPQMQLSVDGRRRALVSIISQALQNRPQRMVLVMEDMHWIDAPSDDVLAQLAESLGAESRRGDSGTVIVMTCRPVYQGPMRQCLDRTIQLEPLSRKATRRLARHLIGSAPSTRELSERIADTAAGNPYFVEEIVRDLADRGVLEGSRGNYRPIGDVSEITVPPTVIAVLTSRIDRLPPAAKAVLNAAAVVGSQFDSETLRSLVSPPLESHMAELVAAELIDQTEFVPLQRYCFHHPLVRKVAYEAQLNTTRARTHTELASIIQAQRNSDENASLIAAHLDAAGALSDSYQWHMRAAQWLRSRDLPAARAQWKIARDIADRLDDRTARSSAMRIAPRALLSSTTLYVGDDADSDAVYEELKELAAESGDLDSLALGMAGRMFSFTVNGNCTPRAVALAGELNQILGSLRCTAEHAGIVLNSVAFTHVADRDFVSARAALDNMAGIPGIPATEWVPALGLRGFIEMCCGETHFGRTRLSETLREARHLHPLSHAALLIYPVFLTALGIPAHRSLVDEVGTALNRADSFADQFGLTLARWLYGTVTLREQPDSRTAAIETLQQAHAGIVENQICGCGLATIATDLAMNDAREGRADSAIERLRRCLSELMHGFPAFAGVPAEALVDLLIERAGPGDLGEAQGILQQWPSGVPALDMWCGKARALLARAVGDADGFRREADYYLDTCRAVSAAGRIPMARRLIQEAA